MDVPHIIFHTKDKSFRAHDGFHDVSDTDIAILLRQVRETSDALEVEMMTRQHKRISVQPAGLGSCCQRLHDMAAELRITERLDVRTAKKVEDAVQIIVTSQTTYHSKTHQSFLHDVLRHCSPSLALLCAGSLGKKRIVEIGSKGRVTLLAYMRDTLPSLDSPVLQSLAKEHQVPLFDSLQPQGLGSRPKKRVRVEGESATGLDTDAVPPGRQIQHRGSEAPVSRMPLLSDIISEAV